MNYSKQQTAENRAATIRRLKEEIESADAIVLGSGAGLSTAAGFIYNGEKFDKYFSDFRDQFGIRDMYAGGFYPFPDEETRWAWWARHIYFNRYIDPPKNVYSRLLDLVKDKEYFSITTNVDHQFQKAGIDRDRLFYTQGDYGLFQEAKPSHRASGEHGRTYDNEDWVMKAMEAQGFVKDEAGIFQLPEDGSISMRIPSNLIPRIAADGSGIITDSDDPAEAARYAEGRATAMNLRADDTFVEDEGWHRAADRYEQFLNDHEGEHVLFLELGVGMNTPVIIKYPFWRMTYNNPNAVYACLNFGETYIPKEIDKQSIAIEDDIFEILKEIILKPIDTVGE